jgi:DNA-binding CsgD family transcriptional regulator
MSDSAVIKLNRLTEGQRDCLRLVLLHLTSKEIARRLGVSAHTVDNRIKAAIRVLGVSSRAEAAHLLAASEGASEYQQLVYQASAIGRNGEIAAGVAVDDHEGHPVEGIIDHIMFSQPASVGIHSNVVAEGNFLPLPRFLGERNDASVASRLGWIVGLATASALGFGAILAGLEALANLD